MSDSRIIDATETRAHLQQVRDNNNDTITLTQALAMTKSAVSSALPTWSDLTPEMIMRDTLEAVRKNHRLETCSYQSILQSMTTCAQLGLRPGVSGQAYLVPFGDECVFILGYRGMIDLAYRSCDISAITAEIVHENDTFQPRLGSRMEIDHYPALDDRGKPKYVYALAVNHIGQTVAAKWMPVANVVEIGRRYSRCRNSSEGHVRCHCPWRHHPEAMWRKTLVRRLEPWLPKRPAFRNTVTPLQEGLSEDTAETTADKE